MGLATQNGFQTGDRALAEEQSNYEFATVTANDILADRERGWEGFTQFLVWSIALTVLALVGLAIFVA